MKLKNYLMFLIMMITSLSFASVNYHGRIINQSTNNPLISSNVRFNFKIKAGATCVVYEENHDNIDMSGSNGYFSHNIGDGATVFGTFDNAMKIDGTVVNCSGGGTVSLTSVIAKSVDVQILEHDGSSYATNVALIAGVQIKDVPVAIEAKSLSGKTASSFIQVSGAVSQLALDNLITGVSSPYVLSTDLSTQVSSLTSGKLNASSNLSDLTNTTTARSNLGLGSLSTQNSVSDAEISSLSWSKLTGVPSTFAPSAHSHPISDITGLQTQLTTLQNNINAKVGSSQLNLNCTSSQTIQYVSVSDSYQCQSIAILSSQVSGLGSLASLNSVSDSEITSMSGTKLTGGVQIGTVSGTTCTSAGLTRYNASNLEFCDGSNWKTISATSGSSVPIISDWASYTPSFNGFGSVTNIKAMWRRVGADIEVIGRATAGSPIASGAALTIPSGLTVDTSKLISDTVHGQILGEFGRQFVSSEPIIIGANSGTTNQLYITRTSHQGGLRDTDANGIITAGEKFSFKFKVPIVGWSANVNLTAPNPVVVRATNSSGQLITQNAQTTVTNWTETRDLSNSFNPTTGIFTAPSAGDYEISASITFGDTLASGDRVVNIRNITTSNNEAENLRPYTSAGSGQITQHVSDILTLNAGDQIAITVSHGASGAQNIVGVARRNILTIKKVGY